MCLAMPKPRIFSEPKTLAIFLSGMKYCLLSGSYRWSEANSLGAGLWKITQSLWVSHLKVVLLDVCPQELHELGAGSLLLADDIGELGAELLGCGETSSGHFVVLKFGIRYERRLTSMAPEMVVRGWRRVTQFEFERKARLPEADTPGRINLGPLVRRRRIKKDTFLKIDGRTFSSWRFAL